MGIPGSEIDRAQNDLTLHLETLRREIGALRQELIESGQCESIPADNSYRLATQVDLLINKFLRLQESMDDKTGQPPGQPFYDPMRF